ncbi:FAD binding domain-containing protein [Methyloceanibacter sp.]|uniref:FAD binding domain-containing protein n=1 Tax=Methyloceanibacter sp. TaxID=1965321 RepID=UPI003D6DA7C5
MNLNTVTEVKQPTCADEIAKWREGYAWLAGGTWLFSTPQIATDTLIDLQSLRWPALQVSADGLDIGATCTVAELDRFQAPPEWTATPLLPLCARAFLASFKIWNAATVGGNICMSLPAGPMITLTVALEGIYTLWPRGAEPRQVAAIDFVTGNHMNVLRPGELLRSIRLPASALCKRFASRRSSLTHLGRSAVFLIGTQSADADDLLLTITAATPRPVQLRFDRVPSADKLRHTIGAEIPDDGYFDDVHGSPVYRRRLTYYYAEQIRSELQSGAAA